MPSTLVILLQLNGRGDGERHRMRGRRPRGKPFVSAIAGHPHDPGWGNHEWNRAPQRPAHLPIHKKILQLLPMPSHAKRAKPVSLSPGPHGQRPVTSITVHREHRPVAGEPGRQAPPFGRQHPPASGADPDFSGNRQQNTSRQFCEGASPALAPAIVHHNERTVTRHAETARKIQPCPVRPRQDTLEDITHMTKGQSLLALPHHSQRPSDQAALQAQGLSSQPSTNHSGSATR